MCWFNISVATTQNVDVRATKKLLFIWCRLWFIQIFVSLQPTRQKCSRAATDEQMKEVVEIRGVWKLNLELLPPRPLRKSGIWKVSKAYVSIESLGKVR